MTAFSQDLTGIWRGYFLTESGDHYKLEFQIKQNPNGSVTGVSYSYLDVRFYGKAKMTGFMANGQLNIQELKTVEIKSLTGGGACLMNFRFTFDQSGREMFLEGPYLGRQETSNSSQVVSQWGDCGNGKAFLRKVPSSDFYVEPFLRNNEPAQKPEEKPVTKTPDTPKKDDQTIAKTKPVEKKPTEKVKTEPVEKADPEKDLKTEQITKKPAEKPKVPAVIPAPIRDRENNLVQTLYVNSKDINIKLYDNGEIDDDSISVYVDNRQVIKAEKLSQKPILVNVKMEETGEEHDVVMVAENLGRIPPNTSLMIVYAGSKRYEVRITSTKQKNAVVRFVYRPSGSPE